MKLAGRAPCGAWSGAPPDHFDSHFFSPRYVLASMINLSWPIVCSSSLCWRRRGSISHVTRMYDQQQFLGPF